jgi:N-acetylglucosamine-6-sulfatase
VKRAPAISRRTLLRGTAVLGAGVAIGRIGSIAGHPMRKHTTRGRGRRRPNIIVITADDMRSDEARYMPNVQRLVAEKGTTFTAARHNISLCSPARAGFLTGQYSKRHRVRSQSDTFEGYNDVQKTLAVWMQNSGYHTGIVGKYFTTIEGETSPPGWQFRRQLADKSQEQHGYKVWDGKATRTPELDQTRYLQREVVSYLESAPEPFFVWFTPTADHSPFQAPPGHTDDYTRLKWPDRREEDVSDKPPWIQSLSPFPDRVLASMRRSQRLRLRELLGLDDTVAEIVKVLESNGQLGHTVIVFTSDNGTFWGEHRIPPGSKNMPYEPAVLVPCIVRGPDFPHAKIRQPVHMSIDLTATCVDLAGATPDLGLDGVSLRDVDADPTAFDDRQLLYDRDNRDGFTFPPPGELPPPAAGIFTRARKLVRYQTEPVVYELYDLESDPGELRNVANHPEYADNQAVLAVALDRMLAS